MFHNTIYIYIYIYAIMKAMCPLGYHHNGLVATHGLMHLGTWCIHIYYTHLASVRFEHSVCRMTTHIDR